MKSLNWTDIEAGKAEAGSIEGSSITSFVPGVAQRSMGYMAKPVTGITLTRLITEITLPP